MSHQQLQPDIRIAFFDIDGTLHRGDTIWEVLHKKNNTWDSHGKPYLTQFLAGEIDFESFARLDVAVWRGLSEATLHQAIDEMELFDSVQTVIDVLLARGCAIYLISNGLAQLADSLVKKHGLSGYRANPLHIEDGVLTGRIDIHLPYQKKDEAIKEILAELAIDASHAMAVGDGPGDVAMLREVRHPFYLNPSKKQVPHYEGSMVNDWNAILTYLNPSIQ